MLYLTKKDILLVHARIIDETGGIHGVRDIHLLESVVERPKGAYGGGEVFQTKFHKAAAYLEGLTRYHVFVDGNKRTAIGASALFLYLNNSELTATDREVKRFILRATKEKLTVEKIAKWLKENSQRLLR